MKREIKFRAWDKAQECYLYDVQGAYDTLSGCVKYENGENAVYDEECFDEFLDNDHYVVEQYTGMHDKNGREIYEGDLLRVELDDDPDSYYIAPVTWGGSDYPAFDIMSKYWPKNVSYDTNVLSAIIAGWSEEVMSVIGNIYENPEMLEDNEC